MILRNRKAVREFLGTSAATEGDVVVVERAGERSITVWLDRAGIEAATD